MSAALFADRTEIDARSDARLHPRKHPLAHLLSLVRRNRENRQDNHHDADRSRNGEPAAAPTATAAEERVVMLPGIATLYAPRVRVLESAVYPHRSSVWAVGKAEKMLW